MGSKQAAIAVKGQNLFYDTQVAIGDKILTGSKDGLRLISDQGMDIVADRSALYGDVAVLGRYGPAIVLQRKLSDPNHTGMTFASDLSPIALGRYFSLAIQPRFDNGDCFKIADLSEPRLGEPIIFLNGAALTGPYTFSSTDGCLTVGAQISESAMPKIGGVVTLKFPFVKGFVASQALYDPTTVFKLRMLTVDKDYLLGGLDGAFVRANQKETRKRSRRKIGGSLLAQTRRSHSHIRARNLPRRTATHFVS